MIDDCFVSSIRSWPVQSATNGFVSLNGCVLQLSPSLKNQYKLDPAASNVCTLLYTVDCIFMLVLSVPVRYWLSGRTTPRRSDSNPFFVRAPVLISSCVRCYNCFSMTMEIPPQIKPYTDKVDAFMAKYPSVTQYGGLPRGVVLEMLQKARYTVQGRAESFSLRAPRCSVP